MNKGRILFGIMFVMILGVSSIFGNEQVGQTITLDLANVQKYYRAIHIMAMLLVGFGFLMVYMKKYGRTALTATFLVVSISIPLYFLKDSFGILGHHAVDIDKFILAEFAAASLLICMGAVLGRLKFIQFIILAILFVPCYSLNEWILLDGGFNLIGIGSIADSGGSLVIHAFGALFGLGAIFSLTSKKEYKTEIIVDNSSERFSLLGSMMLWVFWPSFCAALVETSQIPATVVNVFLALCGSTIATYFASLILRKKVLVADIANATLAGGVAIGATCDKTTPAIAFLIGLGAGIISTYGFAVIQDKLQQKIKKIDTCGVLYLHGLPGLFGGIMALFVVKGVNANSQLLALGVTIVIALLSGLVVGKVISLLGSVNTPYDDSEELIIEDQ